MLELHSSTSWHKLCECESVSGVQGLSCSTCTEVCVTRGVCRLPPSGSCTDPAKDKTWMWDIPSPFGQAWCNTARVQALDTSHPVKQTEIPAELGNPGCNFTLLLADLSLCAQIELTAQLSFLPQFLYCLQLFQVCFWLLLLKWSSTEKYLVSSGVSAVHSFLHLFSFPFLTNFLGNFKNSCGSLQRLDPAITPMRHREDAANFCPWLPVKIYCKICLWGSSDCRK